ncbi:MAG: hypothetical protein JXR72_06890, partial [Proteobacteria bacterium]|nr:hypothetical protein [Pseudomonadota bacterium]
ASLTSSSLNGLIMASTFFIASPPFLRLRTPKYKATGVPKGERLPLIINLLFLNGIFRKEKKEGKGKRGIA